MNVRVLVAAALAGLALGAAPHPASTGDRTVIEVVDTSGRTASSCGAIDTSGRFDRSRCNAFGQAWATDLTIRTAVGATPFGSCTVSLEVNLAGDGRISLDNLSTGGVAPCGDVWACAPDAVVAARKGPADGPPIATRLPWTGRLEHGDGSRFVGHVGFCLDTCVGRYEGRMEIELVRTDHGWTMRATNAGVGTTGLMVSAEWELDDPKFDIRARPL